MMRKYLLASVFVLSACSSTSTPPSSAQIQADLQIAATVLHDAGCLVAVSGAVSAPLIAVTSDDAGNKVLSAVTSVGAAICSTPAPASITSPSGTTLGAVVAGN